MQIEKKVVNTKLVLAGLIIGMFFSSLEQTIVGTAMPTIIGAIKWFYHLCLGNDCIFNSLNDSCTDCWKAI